MYCEYHFLVTGFEIQWQLHGTTQEGWCELLDDILTQFFKGNLKELLLTPTPDTEHTNSKILEKLWTFLDQSLIPFSCTLASAECCASFFNCSTLACDE